MSILSEHRVLTAVDIFNVLVGVPELEEICFDRKVLESMGTMDLKELISLKDRSRTDAQHRWYKDPQVLKRLKIKSFTDLLEVYSKASTLDKYFYRRKSFLQSFDGLIILRKSAKLGDGAYLNAFGALINRITEPMTLVMIDCPFIDQMLSLMSNTEHVVYMAVLFSWEEVISNFTRYSKESVRYARCNRRRLRWTTEMPSLKLLYSVVPTEDAEFELIEAIYIKDKFELREGMNYLQDKDDQFELRDGIWQVLGAFMSVMSLAFEVECIFETVNQYGMDFHNFDKTLVLSNWGIFWGSIVAKNRDLSRMKYRCAVARYCNPEYLLIRLL